jgi:uncharacterized membrane protein HdeD (DUF308 family)
MTEARLDSRIWGGVALRGVVAILFGILALARPDVTALTLVYLFGVFAFIDGVFALVASVRLAEMGGRWWPMLLVGVLGIALGVLAFMRPAATAVGLVYYLAIWAVGGGILEIVAAVRLRKVVQGEWILALTGVLSIALGIMIAARPDAGVLTLTWLIGIYAMLFGVLQIALAVRLRGAQTRLAAV